ncbi:hypothetical protein DESC_700190 [Desulfosarcina cetonica]|nr:hypothetical protein DESC_700190 [Desulfosarcina cetonica]
MGLFETENHLSIAGAVLFGFGVTGIEPGLHDKKPFTRHLAVFQQVIFGVEGPGIGQGAVVVRRNLGVDTQQLFHIR